MTELKELYVLGVSYRTAPVAVREGLHFTPEEIGKLLEHARGAIPEAEALVLSTCNRTEFYLAAAPHIEAPQQWLSVLRQFRPDALILRDDCHTYRHNGAAAFRHMCAVACGLDSAILGDGQVLGQMKNAVAIAGRCGVLGEFLSTATRMAIRTGKRSRTETAIGYGAAGTGSAIAGIIQDRFTGSSSPAPLQIVVVGAGTMARDIGRHLAKRQVGDLIFVNRTDAKASELALHCGGSSRQWTALETLALTADVLITAAGSKEPILGTEFQMRVHRARPENALLIIDAGTPRNVAPGGPIEVLDIDAIQKRQEEAISRRRAALPGVESIIDHAAGTWDQWLVRRPIEGLIRTLYLQADQTSRSASRILADGGAMAPEQAQQFLMRSFKQLLHTHVHELRHMPDMKMAPA